MANRILQVEKLESLLQLRWAEFIDHVQLMRTILEHVRDTSFSKIKQQTVPLSQFKMGITKFKVTPAQCLELCVEYTAPKDSGIVVGTTIFLLQLTGELFLKESYGTHFVPQT